MFYWVLKTVVLGPILKLLFRPWVEGEENIPDDGAAIFASNHLSFSDSIFLPLVVPRRMTFLAKSDYFTGRGLKGRLTAAFFRGVGQLPVDRSGGRAGEAALRSGPEGAAPRRAARHLPRGHPQPRRPALPRSHRRRPDGARGRGQGPARRDDRHRQGPAHRHQDPQADPDRRQDRQAAGLLALRGHGGRPVRPALDHRRDHVRADAAVRPGVRRHVRHVDEGPHPRRRQDQGARAAGGRPAGHGRQGARGGPRRRRRRGRRARSRPSVDDAVGDIDEDTETRRRARRRRTGRAGRRPRRRRRRRPTRCPRAPARRAEDPPQWRGT